MNAPARPLLRWLGGKYRLASWVVSQMPEHRIYLEPYGGAASVLFRKPRAYNEIVNDLDDELVNLFRVMREPLQARLLVRRLKLTPYAEAEYQLALEPAAEPIERAARLIVRSHLGHGSNSARIDRPSGFRCDGRKGTTNVAREWADYPAALAHMVRRLRGVSIRCLPAGEIIGRYRDPKVLIYLDPPYVTGTRSAKKKQDEGFHAYRHEMTDADHSALLDQICDHPAMIMLSGYWSELYAERLAGWRCLTKDARAHRNLPRVERLWLNDACVRALDHGPLFGDGR